MISRSASLDAIRTALKRSGIVALIGPRQCGKTTLARMLLNPESAGYFDLEDPVSLARMEQPKTALEGLSGLVVIDEVQRRPDLFPVLRVLADRQPLPARFLILGSASPELLRQSSESLAGRMEIVELSGLSLAETGAEQQFRHWLRGTYNDAELDLLLFKDGKRTGIECKRADAPRVTASMRIAMQDLKLDSLTVYYPDTKRYPLADNISVEPLSSLGVRYQSGWVDNGVRHSDRKYELVLPWPCRSHRRRGWKFRAGQGSDGSVRALRGTRRDEKTEIFPSSHKFRYSLRRALRIEV